MIQRSEISAVILAGGRATRMGGQDKGLLEHQGQTFAERIATAFASQVSEVIINANRHMERYGALGHRVVSDQLEDFQGPLAGMYSGLMAANTPWIITAPCDGPFVSESYVSKMIEAADNGNQQLAVASDGDWLQPVYALIHRDLAESLLGFLDSGERKIDRWYRSVGFVEVIFDDDDGERMFTNVNTPEQLAELQN